MPQASARALQAEETASRAKLDELTLERERLEQQLVNPHLGKALLARARDRLAAVEDQQQQQLARLDEVQAQKKEDQAPLESGGFDLNAMLKGGELPRRRR